MSQKRVGSEVNRKVNAISENELRDKLEEVLSKAKLSTHKEIPVVPQDRVDLVVLPSSSLSLLTLVELKVADPIRGVGQVLSYQVGIGEPTHPVLVTDIDSFTSQVARACKVGAVECWTLVKGEFKYITGPPLLWNSLGSEKFPFQSYEAFSAEKVETCPCCKGKGKIPNEITSLGDLHMDLDML